MNTYEVNFDGLVGPTHNYAGLAFGNKASKQYSQTQSNPKQAALQGLAKMQRLCDLGLQQAVLPPHARPNLALLYQLGFRGKPTAMLEKAYQQDPALLATLYSASSMWTANAATVSPSADTQDGTLHFTPANLLSNRHRAQETEFTHHLLKTLFADQQYFTVHPPLRSEKQFADEGAANHTRLCQSYSDPGLEFFVYGQHYGDPQSPKPKQYPARQSYESVQLIAQNHQLDLTQVIFAQQNPEIIDAGVFHNDVICVGNQNVLLYHEKSFLNTKNVVEQLKATANFELQCLEIKDQDVSVKEAVDSYLFNSQIISLDETMMLLAPTESEQSPSVYQAIQTLLKDDNPIEHVEFLDLRQSMHNGGGPACLRLRVVMNEEQRQHCHQGVLLDSEKITVLRSWVEKHYRDELCPEDLRDPQLLDESYQALDELTTILALGSVYDFQK